MSNAEKPRVAWLHRAEDVYFTDEQTASYPEWDSIKKSYIKFIEHSAYDAVVKERDDYKICYDANLEERTELREEIDALEAKLTAMELRAVSAESINEILKSEIETAKQYFPGQLALTEERDALAAQLIEAHRLQTVAVEMSSKFEAQLNEAKQLIEADNKYIKRLERALAYSKEVLSVAYDDDKALYHVERLERSDE